MKSYNLFCTLCSFCRDVEIWLESQISPPIYCTKNAMNAKSGALYFSLKRLGPIVGALGKAGSEKAINAGQNIVFLLRVVRVLKRKDYISKWEWGRAPFFEKPTFGYFFPYHYKNISICTSQFNAKWKI
ncbi:hypothetical protein KI659_00045 [Litoribacter alkaliphilus]|uniref:Uncharacterized protein n=1 Tax=Litoribacter ruber TaxID=702568 RepID=A0AAP2G0A6_9BACT|nr:hypothetical protein [Litoribacter alkaliphilus]MBS9522394.1 hypothetical protein [Litoribacter alkaliphilus]